jgi:N-acetylglucosamine-6-phosphate deacetylase
MAAQGVVVSYNSDSDEMARRLNAEAAKAMKYGGLSMEEALKFVTINPAIQLKIESKVGSLEVGKDADFAIWSGPPLSSLSRCEATYIEGAPMFTLAADQAARESVSAERSRLIQKLLVGAKKKDSHVEPKPAPAKPDPKLRDFYAELIRQGQFPGATLPGDCGCNGDQR